MRLFPLLAMLCIAGSGCFSIKHTVVPGILQEAVAVESVLETEGEAPPITPALPPPYRPVLEALADQRAEVNALLQEGILGEANTGYLAGRPDAQQRDEERAQRADVLSAIERVDRSKLFRRMSNEHWSLGLTPRLAGAYYARQRLEHLAPGVWAQLPERGPLYLNFLATPLADRLGPKALPSAWVKIPE